MVTTSYQCSTPGCAVQLVTIVKDEGIPLRDQPLWCPGCDAPMQAAPDAPAPAEPAPTPAPAIWPSSKAGDVEQARAVYHSALAALTAESDQVTHAAPGGECAGAGEISEGSDQVSQGDGSKSFEPPRLRLLGRDDLAGRGSSPRESAAVAELRKVAGNEGPAEHIRNALQILAGVVAYDGALLQDPPESLAVGIAARLVHAAEQLPIGGDAPDFTAVLIPLQAFKDAVSDLAHCSAAHQDTARQAIAHTGQMLRFALNSALNAMGPGAAPVPAEILAQFAGADPQL